MNYRLNTRKTFVAAFLATFIESPAPLDPPHLDEGFDQGGSQGQITARLPMGRALVATLVAGLLLSSVGFVRVKAAVSGGRSSDLAVPRVRMNLDGPMAARLDAIIENWLIPAPEANPGDDRDDAIAGSAAAV